MKYARSPRVGVGRSMKKGCCAPTAEGEGKVGEKPGQEQMVCITRKAEDTSLNTKGSLEDLCRR